MVLAVKSQFYSYWLDSKYCYGCTAPWSWEESLYLSFPGSRDLLAYPGSRNPLSLTLLLIQSHQLLYFFLSHSAQILVVVAYPSIWWKLIHMMETDLLITSSLFTTIKFYFTPWENIHSSGIRAYWTLGRYEPSTVIW